MAWSEPTNPVGTYDPAYMSNVYGASWSTAWNNNIYGSPTQVGADVLCNCVGYAEGRMLRLWLSNHPEFNPSVEQTHPFLCFGLHDAGEWKQVALDNGFTVLNDPVPGSVLVTPSHVAVVEKEENGVWMVSESGYASLPPFLYHNSLYKSGGQWYSSYATTGNVIGFIVIPDFDPGPGKKQKYDRHRRYRTYYEY